MTPITAVVLAGGRPDEVAALQPGSPNKAFVRVAGVPMVARAISGLRSSSNVGHIIAVAPASTHSHPALAGADERRLDGTKIRASLRQGLEGLAPDELVLVAASDLPMLSTSAVDDFIQRARALDPDIGYGCLEKSVHMARYPRIPHTWARLSDGTYCGGGLVALKPRVLPALEQVIERLGAARKKPLHLASLFGYGTLLKFALGQLTVAHAEARASDILGQRVRAIISPFPETAVNIDRASDVALVEELLFSQAQARAQRA